MAVGIGEVEAPSAIAPVDLASLPAAGVGEVLDSPLGDPGEDLIELLFADEEGVVLRRDVSGPASWKSIETSLSSSTIMNGPKGTAGGRPRISVAKAADRCLSVHQTMVWLSCTAIGAHVTATGRPE